MRFIGKAMKRLRGAGRSPHARGPAPAAQPGGGDALPGEVDAGAVDEADAGAQADLKPVAEEVAPLVAHWAEPGPDAQPPKKAAEDAPRIYNDGYGVKDKDKDNQDVYKLKWQHHMRTNARLVTTPLLDKYVGEEFGGSEAERAGTLKMGICDEEGPYPVTGTHYASGSSEYGTQVQAGKLTAAGKPITSADTVTATGQVVPGSRHHWFGEKDERLNFVMDGTGRTYVADHKRDLKRLKQTQGDGSVIGERSNHSSLVAGANAAAAGKMKLRDGEIEAIGDSSGHYHPGTAQTFQAVQEYRRQGALDPARATVELQEKDGVPLKKGHGLNLKSQRVQEALNGTLQLSAQELLAHGDAMREALADYEASGDTSDLNRPEAGIRIAHAKKGMVLDELLRKTPRQ